MERHSRSVSRARAVPDWMNLLRLVWAIENRLSAVSRYLQGRWNVNGQQRIIVRLVSMYPGITATEIADAFDFHPSTTSGNLKHLLRAGMLERQSHEDDARRSCFFVTEGGKPVDDLEQGTAEAAVRRAMAEFREDEVEIAQRILARLLEELDRELASSQS